MAELTSSPKKISHITKNQQLGTTNEHDHV
jgi:hypothetical protein